MVVEGLNIESGRGALWHYASQGRFQLVPPRGAVLAMMRVSPPPSRGGLPKANEMRVGLDGPDEVSYVELGLACNNVYIAPPPTRG